MPDDLLPGDFDPIDGWAGDRGLEICPVCEDMLTGQGAHHGPAFDQDGYKHDSIYDADVTEGPFFCPDCWQELDANRRAAENETLEDYA